MSRPDGGSGQGDAERPLRRVGVGGRTAEFAPNALTPAQAEAAIATEDEEWMYVYDDADRQVARFRGTSEEVDFSDGLKRRTGVLGLYGESVLTDHLIVHNHPVRPDVDLVSSFPPSTSDLAMAVERDLRALVVVSGGRRYAVRRPGAVRPLDEGALADTIDALADEMETEAPGIPQSLPGNVDLFRRILQRLHDIGVIDYDEQAGTSRL